MKREKSVKNSHPIITNRNQQQILLKDNLRNLKILYIDL